MNRRIIAASRALCVILGVCGLLGCASQNEDDDSSRQRVPDAKTGSSREDIPDADSMNIHSVDNKEFYIMRVHDDYLEIPGTCNLVYKDTGEYPDLEDGEIARVVADVAIYNGGVAGYTGNSFIKELKETEKLTFHEADNVLDIPDIADGDFEYDKRLLKYQKGDDLYLVVLGDLYVDIYQNGTFYGKYERDAYDDAAQGFYEILAGGRGESAGGTEGTAVPEFSEKEILNMSEDDLLHYGDLAADHLLADVRIPHPVVEAYDIEFDGSSPRLGRAADYSAADEAEAWDIARGSWEAMESTNNSWKNIRLLGDNGKYWFFECDNYFEGEFNLIDTLMVYHKDYFNAEKGQFLSAVDENSLRSFFACRDMNRTIDPRTCIGEFMDEDDEGLYFRRYYLHISYGDWGVCDTVYLDMEEWRITPDGVIDNVDDPLHKQLRESEIPWRENESPM